MTNRKDKIYSLEKNLKSKLYQILPDYRYSNDIFEDWIKQKLNQNSIWVDAGCGQNLLIEEFEIYSKNGLGIDEVFHPELRSKEKFLQSNLYKIPLPDNYADLIVSNMVIEHIEDISKLLKEIYRILKPQGSFIFRTTNKLYPIQILSSIFSKNLKDKIINSIYGVSAHDVFETCYKLNTYKKIKRILPTYGFKIQKLIAIEDIHLFNNIIFRVSVLLFRIQKLKPFYWTRNCLICHSIKEY